MSINRTQNGQSTPMPSVQLDLGRYVQLRPRADGTARVLFIVPPRLRPSGWSSAIPLPITGERRGDLTDLGEIARIQADARRLYADLLRARAGTGEDGTDAQSQGRRDLPALNRIWQSSQDFKAKKPRTQQGYSYHAGLIADWSAAIGHKPVAGLNRQAIEEFLALYDDRPTTRRHVKIVLKMLLDMAVAIGWRADNPAAKIKVKAPVAKIRIWEAEDVARETWACVMAGQAPIAALILTQWEIGQRLTDVRLYRQGAEYQPPKANGDDGAFRFWQSKTDNYVTIPVSERLQGLLEAVRDPKSLYLFVDRATGKPFAEQRLGHVFAAIRDAFPASKARRLTLRSLRHSCVVQLARAGCTVPEIASITGHSPFSVEQILSKYLPRDNKVAWNAQQKRGLIRTEAEQESNGQPTRESNDLDPNAGRSANFSVTSRC